MQLFRMRISLVAFTATALAAVASAYVVTSPQVLPVGVQKKWLKQLTTDLVQAAPGQLSDSQLSESHDLMYAWSHTAIHNKECALQVETLLKRVIDERRAGNVQAIIGTEDYNCLLEGWAQSGLGEASALRTEQILEAMQEVGPQPNLSSFKACLQAWRHANVHYAAIRAHRILEWMIRLYNDGENVEALPDADCFDTVLQLWSRSGDEQAQVKTEKLLGVMVKLHRSTGLEQLKPRQSSFNAVLSAWSKSGAPTAPDRVTEIFNFMEVLGETDVAAAPDSASYNIVMNTYARSKDPVAAAVKADAFLKHVVENYYKQSAAVADYSDGPEPVVVKPNTILFNTAMGLWAKANKSGSYQRSRTILDRQIALAEDYRGGKGYHQNIVNPDVFGLTSVISSCAAETGNSEERRKAFQIAAYTYRQLDTLGVEANHVTYGTMLKCCAKLLPIKSPIRRKWVKTIFADAVLAAGVGDMVVSKLREACPSHDLYKELMEGHSRKDLPVEWTANVHEQSEYRNKKPRRGKRAEV